MCAHIERCRLQPWWDLHVSQCSEQCKRGLPVCTGCVVATQYIRLHWLHPTSLNLTTVMTSNYVCSSCGVHRVGCQRELVKTQWSSHECRELHSQSRLCSRVLYLMSRVILCVERYVTIPVPENFTDSSWTQMLKSFKITSHDPVFGVVKNTKPLIPYRIMWKREFISSYVWCEAG